MEPNLVSFLLRAKRNTYAAHGAEVPASRPNSHDLSYREGDLLYLDTYLGGMAFAGEEAVWDGETPIWSMNYCGRVTGEGFRGDFLKEALLRGSTDQPYRGPETYSEGDLTYLCHVDGTFLWFQGYEEILRENVRVYECYFHGGSIR